MVKKNTCVFISGQGSNLNNLIRRSRDNNFPIIINHDKYPSFKKTFKQGLPYVQIIPFKRDSWKKKISTKTKKINNNFKYFSKLIDRYKHLIWSKKTWK